MIRTRLGAMFRLRYPIVLAPMGGVAGGKLAACVSNAGALGLVGGGYGDAGWLRNELAIVKELTQRPWGVGFITWSVQSSVIEVALEHAPAAVMLSFGDPRPHARLVTAAGCKLICQVQDLEGARLAQEAGADVIVTQGTEAGGHGGRLATLPLVPAVVDAVAPTPVVAAGGIVDGRGLAAALMLGAQGALMGTRFYASDEALARDEAKRRIVAGHGGQTARTRVFDVVRGLDWPPEHTGRALRNGFLARWAHHVDELAADPAAERTRYQAALAAGDFDTAVVWAGEGIDLIHGVEGAASLVARIGAEAAAVLQAGAALAPAGNAGAARAIQCRQTQRNS
ncbi:MAG: NAD(P)H-dependent flavin oxidoreductase [Betaproteobacteria bacterium]